MAAVEFGAVAAEPGPTAPGVAAAPPFLPFHRPCIGQEEIDAVADTLRSGWLTMGPKTRAFEGSFSAAVGAPAAVAVSSATAGLHLALNAVGVGPGDDVLVPTLTFTATAAAVVHAGGRPVLVDCEPDTLNISAADAERKWTPRTKAIVPVHFAGHPCEMDPILALARERGAAVVEDAAHALPARYRGRWIGSIGDLTVFSFYATKNLTTGEGGMVTTADEALAERVRVRRLHGMTRDAWKRYGEGGTWRYDVSYPGFKYNMTDLNAALGLVQLRRLPDSHRERVRLVDCYRAVLSDVEALELPCCQPHVEHAWHLFTVRVRAEQLNIGRDEVISELAAAGIGTSVHFIPLHEHSYYRDALGVRLEELPCASAEWRRLISLPLYPGLTAGEVGRVAETLRGIVRRHRR